MAEYPSLDFIRTARTEKPCPAVCFMLHLAVDEGLRLLLAPGRGISVLPHDSRVAHDGEKLAALLPLPVPEPQPFGLEHLSCSDSGRQIMVW